MGKEHKVHRSARTGEFVSEEFADKHPNTTVEETVETPDPSTTEGNTQSVPAPEDDGEHPVGRLDY